MTINQKLSAERFRRGFSLAEMLVTVAIISLISTMVVAGYRAGEKKYTLRVAAQQLLSDIRKAQNMALAPTLYSSYRPGMGISFDLANPTKYFFFLDNNAGGGDRVYGSGDVITSYGEVDLPVRVKIKSITLAGLTPNTKLDVFFAPPDPTTYINGINDLGILAIITLELAGETLTKTLTIRTSGLID